MSAPARQVGGMTEYLGIHEIAEAYETSDKGYGDYETVKCPQRAAFGGENGVEDHANYDTDGAAVACETTLPDVKDADGVLLIDIPLIEEHVAETRADNSSGYGPQEQEAKPFLRRTLVAVDTGLDLVADKEAYHESEAIPTDAEITDMEKERIGVPDDEI